jgi:2-hydroxy-6-oxonona-2,4-dienedioate hydrolase
MASQIPAVEVQDTWIQADGYQMHARVSARDNDDRPAVVVIHGLSAGAQQLTPLLGALGKDFRVSAPSLPGFGGSERPSTALDLAELADSVVAWMDASGVRQAAVVGISVGCHIAVELALRCPRRVSRLALLCPTMAPGSNGGSRQVGQFLINTVREGPRQMFEQFQASLRPSTRLLLHNIAEDPLEEKLPEVRIPTLIVRGERDPLVPQAWAEELTALLPKGELAVIPGATHGLNRRSPEALAEAMRPFLMPGGLFRRLRRAS